VKSGNQLRQSEQKIRPMYLLISTC